MMRVLWFIVLVAIIASSAAWLADRPGDVAVVWHGYRIETSVAVAAAAFLAALAAGVIIWTMIRLALRLPDIVGMATRGRRRQRGMTALSRGMVAVGSGDAAMARRYALEAEKLLGREPMALLLRAQAAQLANDRKTAEMAFRAMLDVPESRVLGLRGLYVEARRSGELQHAYAFAGKAAQIDPGLGWANEGMLEFYGAQRRWGDALAMLERRLSTGRMDRGLARRQRAVLLTADGLDRQDADPDGALRAVREAVKLAPDLVPAVALLGRLLARQGALRKAAKALEAGWRIQPHPEIAAAYVDLRPGDSALDRLDRARALQRLAPGHEEARLIVARAAIDAREYERARATLAPLLQLRPQARVCLMMAEIAGASPAGAGEVREWLARASRAPRDPAWIADGLVADHWEPVSPVTGKLDAFVWTTPTELLAHAPAAKPRDHRDDAKLAAPAPVVAAGGEAPAGSVAAGLALAGDGAAAAAPEEEVATPGDPASGASSGRRDSGSPDPGPGNHGSGDARPDDARPGNAVPADGARQKAPQDANRAAASDRDVRPHPLAEVVFPIARAPDDPGPGGDDQGDEAPSTIRRITI